MRWLNHTRALVVAAACGAFACGDTATSVVTGPELPRCAVAFGGPIPTVAAAGGRVEVPVVTARDCDWNAASEAPWIDVAPKNGQGEVVLTLTVAANEIPQPRTGSVVISSQRATVSQEPGRCRYSLSAGAVDVGHEGGRTTTRVATATGCEWSAQSDAPWARVLTPSGTGDGQIEIDVERNPGTPRTARVTVADQALTVTQGAVPLVWIPHSQWTLHSVDSEEQSFPARFGFDGNPSTFWHTEYSKAAPPPPHEIGIDLGATYDIAKVRYLPRQDGSGIGRIGRYELYISLDGASWGPPVAAGTLADVATAQEIGFSRRPGRYIRLRALTEVNGRDFTSMAELDVLAAR